MAPHGFLAHPAAKRPLTRPSGDGRPLPVERLRIDFGAERRPKRLETSPRGEVDEAAWKAIAPKKNRQPLPWGEAVPIPRDG